MLIVKPCWNGNVIPSLCIEIDQVALAGQELAVGKGWGESNEGGWEGWTRGGNGRGWGGVVGGGGHNFFFY